MRTFTALLVFLILISIPILAVEPNATGLKRPQLQSNMDMNFYSLSNGNAITVTGLVTAASYRGDGSQLTGVGGASQTPITQDINGASHTISNAAFSGAFIGLPLAVETSTNLDRVARLFQKLTTMNTAQTNFTMFQFGDSVALPDQSPGNSIYNHLAAMFGPLSANQDDYMMGYSMAMQPAGGNASYVVGPDVNWYSDYLNIPAGATGAFTNAYGNGYFHDCRGADFFWTAIPGGGNFTIQSDGGTGFTNLITVSGLAATQQEKYTNVLVFSGNVGNCRFRVVGGTGTNLVTLCLPQFGLVGSQNRVRMIYGGKGGINIGNGVGTFMGVDSNTLWSAVNLMHPDMIMWHAKHEASWSGAFSTNFPYLMNLFRSAAPQAETLLVGSYPATTDASQGLVTPILRQYAVTSSVPCTFIDLAANSPDTNYAQANLWFVEGASPGLHYTLPSYDAVLAPYFKYWGLNQSSNGAVVIPNLHIGAGALVNDPDRPFRALTASGGSTFSLYFLPSSPGVYFDIDGQFSQEFSPNGTITYPTRGAPIRWAQNSSTWPSTLWGQFTTNGGFYVGGATGNNTASRGQVMADSAFLGSSGLSLDVSHAGFGVLNGGLSLNGAETNRFLIGPGLLSIDDKGGRGVISNFVNLTLNLSTGTLTGNAGGGGGSNAIANLNGIGTNLTAYADVTFTNLPNQGQFYFFYDPTNKAIGWIAGANYMVWTNGLLSANGPTNTAWGVNQQLIGWLTVLGITNNGAFYGTSNILSGISYAASYQGLDTSLTNANGRTISQAISDSTNSPAFVANSTFATTAGGAPPTGSAGGVLGGTYPNPSLGSFSSANLKAALTDYNFNWPTNIPGPNLTGGPVTNALNTLGIVVGSSLTASGAGGITNAGNLLFTGAGSAAIDSSGAGLNIGSQYAINSGPDVTIGSASMNGSALDAYPLYIAPTINQSGSAGFSALRVNVTENSRGTGSSNLMSLEVSSTKKFRVDDMGNAFSSGAYNGGGGGLTNLNSTNIVVNSGILSPSSNQTNYTVPLYQGPSGNLLRVFLANTNAFLTFSGTNQPDWQRTVWFDGVSNSVVSTVTLNLLGAQTNLNVVFAVTNGTSKLMNFYNPDTTGTNLFVSDAGTYKHK